MGRPPSEKQDGEGKQKKRNKKDEPIFKTKEIPDNKKRLSKTQQETQSMLTSLD